MRRLHDAEGVRRQPAPAPAPTRRWCASRLAPGEQMQVDWAVMRRGPTGSRVRWRPWAGARAPTSSSSPTSASRRRSPPTRTPPGLGASARGTLRQHAHRGGERNALRPRPHRFQAGFLTFTAIAASGPGCASPSSADPGQGRALHRSPAAAAFYVPLASRLGQEGLVPTGRLTTWRRVAGCARSPTSGSMPRPRGAGRAPEWNGRVAAAPPPYGGRSVRQIQAPAVPAPLIGGRLQHPCALHGLSA